ncbi:MAG: TraR/DksA family transcriptional regulator [Bdellovibrionales bacterium]
MIDARVLALCKQKLLQTKADLMNRFQVHVMEFRERESGGDEADQTVSLLNENQLFITHQRLRHQLAEIESALARIERGTYGICEETEEPIENERLLAIPWTTLSIEGAEIRESTSARRDRG